MSRRPRVWSILLGVLVSAAILLPTAYFLRPSLQRWRIRTRVLSDLAASETHRRERALNELIAHVAHDDILLRGAAAQLTRAEPINVVQILNALRLANVIGDDRVIATIATTSASMQVDDLHRCFAVFLAAQHADDPRLVGALINRLDNSDDEAFAGLVSMLKQTSRWSCPPVPASAYLRWLRRLGESRHAPSRATAARRAGTATGLAGEPQMRILLERWLNDANLQVRHEALLATAELATGNESRDAYLSLIARSRRHVDSAVARTAWIMLDQFEAVPADVLPPDPRPAVAEAALWVTSRDARSSDEAIGAVTDRDARRRLVGMQAYVSAVRHDHPDRDTIVKRLQSGPINQTPIDETTQVQSWRLLLALRAIDTDRSDPIALSLFTRFAELDADDPLLGPLAVVAAHCHPSATLSQTVAHTDYPVRALAAIEGLGINDRSVHLAADAAPLLRVMAAAVTREPDPQDLAMALGSRDATLRDLACATAVRRLRSAQLSELVKSLLRDFNDDAKKSGAILAGLSGIHDELLAHRIKHEDNWRVRQILRLGMWLQGRPVQDDRGQRIDMPKLASSLLARDDMPRSTILLAMLYAPRPRPAPGSSTPNLGASSQPQNMEDHDALEILLHPRGANWIDLHDMLATRRWWHVLRPYLPIDAPPLWLWADQELQEFQLEVLRCWYLVNGRGR